MGQLIHELIFDAAARAPAAPALRHHGANHSYAALARDVAQAGAALRALGAQRHDRVAVWLPCGIDAVVALFGAAAAGCALVPVDPECDGRRAALLLADAGPRVLVTTAAHLAELGRARSRWPQLRLVILCGEGSAAPDGALLMGWQEFMALHAEPPPAATVETDLAALLYSGGAARPTGIALSHRNLVAAADSAVRYLDIGARDRLLAALPFSLDQGLNQLTCAFAAGALVVLPEAPGADTIVRAVEREEITGLAGVPGLWAELAGKDWGRATTLRYATSVGAPLARPLVDTLRRALPRTRIYLMYGFTEAFRSTCLAPEQIAWRPDSIGKPAPGAEVLVLRPDGRRCAPGEAGELVQRGPMVALGYWNDPKRTAARFRALPPRPGLSLPEMAVWSGDLVRADADGYLYVVRRADDSIRTGGIRVDPADVEQAVYDTGLVHEAAAVGVAHPVQGQVIAVLARARAGCRLDSAILFDACQARLPPYMLPTMVDVRRAPLPRAADGLIDRALLAGELAPLFAEATS